MTREEAIDRWSEIASSIFWAEENIAQEWHERLKEAPTLNKEEQHALAGEYCKAIATEIVKKMTDEQLEKIE